MERPEIIAGIKSALERGYSLNLAIQSFINAGYNRQDVEDSAKALGGTAAYTPPQTPLQTQKPIQQTSMPAIPIKTLQQLPAQPINKPKKKHLIFIIILIILLVLLLSFLFTFIFAKDFVISLLEKLGYNFS